ncbi:MAG TPA: glutamate 5-kinase [Armatimonadota bacterium]|nr:glutamate 5-kinase [Armatimonadota bacterium]
MKTQGNQPQRIVVKVGTSTLTGGLGKIDRDYIKDLVAQIVRQVSSGKQCVIVTSGAIRAGVEKLKLDSLPRTIPEKQAAAAVGQGILLHTYAEYLNEMGISAAQLLLTRDDFVDRQRYLNARNTLNSLLSYGCVPIINENDTIAVDEIKFGDNDTLAALVASALNADLLILLSDTPGLYDRDPSLPGCQVIPEISVITPEIRALAGDSLNGDGTGSMKIRIEAAEIATSSGVEMVIVDGRYMDVIDAVIREEPIGTRFLAGGSRLSNRKRWVAFSTPVRGVITVNEGAKKMVVEGGKSLLPVGIVDVSGTFQAGDLIAIADEQGTRVARGFANYSATEIRQIKGLKTSQIEKVLGYKDFDEVVHRDNLVIGV